MPDMRETPEADAKTNRMAAFSACTLASSPTPRTSATPLCHAISPYRDLPLFRRSLAAIIHRAE